MSLALGIGLLIAGLSDRKADTWAKFLRHTLEWILSGKMVLRLGLCILVIALTTTHSRMGNTAFFSALLVAGAIGIALSRHAPRNTVILLASLIAIDLFIVGSWFGVEKLAQRLVQTSAHDVELREEPAEYAIPMIRDYAAFGSGPGTFYVTFPRYRPPTVLNFYDETHNDYVQFASESGLPGLAIIGLFVAASLVGGPARAVAASRPAHARHVVRLHHGRDRDPHPLVGRLQPADPRQRGALHGAARARLGSVVPRPPAGHRACPAAPRRLGACPA